MKLHRTIFAVGTVASLAFAGCGQLGALDPPKPLQSQGVRAMFIGGDPEPAESSYSVQWLDVKPGSNPNRIKINDGVFAVALLGGDPLFDLSNVDIVNHTLLLSVCPLAGNDCTATDNPPLRTSSEDVNGDGYVDLVAHYPREALNDLIAIQYPGGPSCPTEGPKFFPLYVAVQYFNTSDQAYHFAGSFTPAPPPATAESSLVEIVCADP